MGLLKVFKAKKLIKRMIKDKVFRDNFLKEHNVSEEDKVKFKSMLGKKKGDE